MTNMCLLQQIFVKFCNDKHTFVITKDVRVCHDKTFVATKMILVGAPTNDKIEVE